MTPEQKKIAEKLDKVIEAYKFNAYLTSGGMGHIYVFDHKRLPDIQVVIKVLKPELLEDFTQVKDFKETIAREISLLASCKHPNIIRIFDRGSLSLILNGKKNLSLPFYVMDYLDDYKTLYDHISENIKDLEIKDIFYIFKQILSGVGYMHSLKIFHNDLKGPNIYVSSNNSVVVADFGFAKRIEKDKGKTSRTGTPEYNDPEIYQFGKIHEELKNKSKTLINIPRKKFREKGKKWDLYAIGVTFDKALKIIYELDNTKLSSRDKDYLNYVITQLKSHEADGYQNAEKAIFDIDKNMETFGTELLVPELAHFPIVTRRLPPEQSVPMSNKIFAIHNHPWFQRLSNIRQLGLAHLVYEGARHTRREHSLGVYYNALSYIQALLSGTSDSYFRGIIHPKDIYALLASALLHDIGHIPFAHSFEDIDKTFSHEDLTIKIIDGSLKDYLPKCNHTISDILIKDWNTDISAILAIINKKQKLTGGDADKIRILRSILSGPVDIDKLDYLKRDSCHTGVPYGKSFDDSRFLQSLVIHPKNKNSIALLEKGRVGAEQFVQARYQMYSEVYWYHEVRAYESMLSKAIQFFLLENTEKKNLNDGTILKLLLNSSDDYILKWLYENGNEKVKFLINAILCEKPFETVLQYQKKDIQHGEIWETIVNLRWKEQCDINNFNLFTQNLVDSFSKAIGRAIKPYELLIDVPNPMRYKIGSVDVVLHDKEDPEPLGMTSLLWNSIEADFQNWVQKLRVFAESEVKIRLKKLSSTKLNKCFYESLEGIELPE